MTGWHAPDVPLAPTCNVLHVNAAERASHVKVQYCIQLMGFSGLHQQY
jgi:hypothetical protein